MIHSNRRLQATAGLLCWALAGLLASPVPAGALTRVLQLTGDAPFDAGSPSYVAVRWLWYLSLTLGIGAVAFRCCVLPRVRLPGSLRTELLLQLAALGRAAALFSLLAGGVRLLAQSYAVLGEVSGEITVLLTGTTWGGGWWLQTVSAAFAFVGFHLAARRVRGGWLLAALATLAGAVAPAFSGHAVAARLQPWPIVADTLHVLGAGGWIGSLGVLLIAALPVAMHARFDDLPDTAGLAAIDPGLDAAAGLVRAFSALALSCVAVLLLTGVFAGWLHIGSFAALLHSAYGKVLMLKLAALLPALTLGAYNFRRLQPVMHRPGTAQRLQRSARVELSCAVLVLLLTAVLVATPQPADAAMSAAVPAAPAVAPGSGPG